jgi:hypothetical protein
MMSQCGSRFCDARIQHLMLQLDGARTLDVKDMKCAALGTMSAVSAMHHLIFCHALCNPV